jgi:hypothetical protein
METYTEEYTGETRRLDYPALTAHPEPVLGQHRVDFTMLLIASAAVLLLLVLLARLPETAPASAAPEYGSYTVGSSYNNNSWEWDWCVGYCPR